MRREAIDEFLQDEPDAARELKQIAEKYRISDFVKVSEPIKEYFKTGHLTSGDGIHGCLYEVREDALIFYNKVYWKCGYTHHATRHFSLIEYLMEFDKIVRRHLLGYKFEKALDLFVFHYRAIYAEERLSAYMYDEAKEKIKRSLVDVED